MGCNHAIEELVNSSFTNSCPLCELDVMVKKVEELEEDVTEQFHNIESLTSDIDTLNDTITEQADITIEQTEEIGILSSQVDFLQDKISKEEL